MNNHTVASTKRMVSRGKAQRAALVESKAREEQAKENMATLDAMVALEDRWANESAPLIRTMVEVDMSSHISTGMSFGSGYESVEERIVRIHELNKADLVRLMDDMGLEPAPKKTLKAGLVSMVMSSLSEPTPEVASADLEFEQMIADEFYEACAEYEDNPYKGKYDDESESYTDSMYLIDDGYTDEDERVKVTFVNGNTKVTTVGDIADGEVKVGPLDKVELLSTLDNTSSVGEVTSPKVHLEQIPDYMLDILEELHDVNREIENLSVKDVSGVRDALSAQKKSAQVRYDILSKMAHFRKYNNYILNVWNKLELNETNGVEVPPALMEKAMEKAELLGKRCVTYFRGRNGKMIASFKDDTEFGLYNKQKQAAKKQLDIANAGLKTFAESNPAAEELYQTKTVLENIMFTTKNSELMRNGYEAFMKYGASISVYGDSSNDETQTEVIGVAETIDEMARMHRLEDELNRMPSAWMVKASQAAAPRQTTSLKVFEEDMSMEKLVTKQYRVPRGLLMDETNPSSKKTVRPDWMPRKLRRSDKGEQRFSFTETLKTRALPEATPQDELEAELLQKITSCRVNIGSRMTWGAGWSEEIMTAKIILRSGRKTVFVKVIEGDFAEEEEFLAMIDRLRLTYYAGINYKLVNYLKEESLFSATTQVPEEDTGYIESLMQEEHLYVTE